MSGNEERKVAAQQQLRTWLDNKPNLDETCVVHQALNLLANKWLLLILLALMQRTKRNSELQRHNLVELLNMRMRKNTDAAQLRNSQYE